ncbi:TIM barrel protein [Ruminococcaceae bacterium OttesenSCG-928-D13]|nr:TIM barrel protein [Ruminococcaceae bacterium OttesenSCG-928-D13]
MNYSACLDLLYFRQPMDVFLNGMQVAKDAGMDGIEFWSWWDKDIDAIAAQKNALGLEISTFLTKPVSLGEPGKREEFLEELEKSIAVAKRLGCPSLIAQAGYVQPFLSQSTFKRNMLETLLAAAPILENAGITLVVEPLNTKVDHGGYFLSTSEDSFGLIERVGSPNIKVLFDIYHQQITEGNVLNNIRDHLGYIGHMHAAANPGRGEITGGELDYRSIFAALDAMGYHGWMGLEYRPTKDVSEGLVEARKLFA